jgi:hypothetical protein
MSFLSGECSNLLEAEFSLNHCRELSNVSHLNICIGLDGGGEFSSDDHQLLDNINAMHFSGRNDFAVDGGSAFPFYAGAYGQQQQNAANSRGAFSDVDVSIGPRRGSWQIQLGFAFLPTQPLK